MSVAYPALRLVAARYRARSGMARAALIRLHAAVAQAAGEARRAGGMQGVRDILIWHL